MEPEENKTADCKLFCYAVLAEEFNNTIYSDATGKFPVPSYHGNCYVMIIYVYNANAILVHPMKNREKETMVNTFKEVYDFLKQRKLTPKLHIMDNECSKVLMNYTKGNNNTKIQFVERDNHRVNASECALQTFKNHILYRESVQHTHNPHCNYGARFSCTQNSHLIFFGKQDAT